LIYTAWPFSSSIRSERALIVLLDVQIAFYPAAVLDAGAVATDRQQYQYNHRE
jgi:hypothetical protein